jgi:hypothetical protein
MQGPRSNTSLLHDDMVNRQQTGEPTNTLIAVGTQVGKVLIFDILGLLIHEIAMDVAVRSVEWVGDMSAPPVLPARSSSSPESNSVINALIEEIGDIESLIQHLNAVRDETQEQTNEQTPMTTPVASALKDVTAKPLTPAAFSSPAPSQADSLYRLDAPREHGGTPPSTQTSVGNQAIVAARGRDTLDPGTRKQTRTRKMSIANPRCKHRASSSELSYHLSPGARSSQPEYFTASSTRHSSTRQNKAVHNVDGPARDRVAGTRDHPVRYAGEDASASLRQDQNERVSGLLARPTGRSNAVWTETLQPVAAAGSPRPYPEPQIEERESPVWSNNFDQTQSTMLNQLATRGVAAKQARVSKRPKILEYVPSVPITEACPSHDSSSSLYSRPKSRIFRGRTEVLDGGVDATTLLPCPTRDPRRSFRFSFDAGLPDLELPAERQYATAGSSVPWQNCKHEGIGRLLKDNELLRHQIAGLRNDFQALKTVLLRSESSRRWQDCVS